MIVAIATRYLYVVECEFGSPEREAAWNAWYDDVHVPNMLAVQGIHSVTRYARLGATSSYLAVYEIDSPEVFDQESYQRVRGWGEWADSITRWSRSVLRRDGDKKEFGGES
jgi:hypothetical protein